MYIHTRAGRRSIKQLWRQKWRYPAPAPLDLVSISLVEAARRTGLPLVTYDVELWQYARGLVDVVYVHELCV